MSIDNILWEGLGDAYLWMCLNDCLPSCSVRFFSVGPEELVIPMSALVFGASGTTDGLIVLHGSLRYCHISLGGNSRTGKVR